jgi:hypothetical protein
MTVTDIIDWCKANGEVAWLKKTAATEIDGRKITFIELKKAFVDKFMPEIAPKSTKKPSMYELIAALED